MRNPETASPSLTIRRSITCECDQHLRFSAEVQKPLVERVAFSEARPRCESSSEAGAPPPGYTGRDRLVPSRPRGDAHYQWLGVCGWKRRGGRRGSSGHVGAGAASGIACGASAAPASALRDAVDAERSARARAICCEPQ